MGEKAFYDRPELTFRLPDVRRFWVDVTAGRFDEAAETYGRQSNWERRSHLLGLAIDMPAESDALDRWAADWSEHPLPLIAKGLNAVGWAWQVRTSDLARNVSTEQFEEFHRRLRMAEQILTSAIRADPESPIPWMGLLTSGRGLQISLHEVEYRMEQMAARYPLYGGFSAYLQFVCKKWFGSHEQMWEFADSVNEAAPSGSPLHAVQADATIERFLGRTDLLRPKAALKAEGRLDPLLRAAEQSVLDSSFDADCPAGIRALSSFVVAFERYGCRKLNRHLVPMLRRHWMAEYPFCYFTGRFSHAAMWRSLRGRYRVMGVVPGRGAGV